MLRAWLIGLTQCRVAGQVISVLAWPWPFLVTSLGGGIAVSLLTSQGAAWSPCRWFRWP